MYIGDVLEPLLHKWIKMHVLSYFELAKHKQHLNSQQKWKTFQSESCLQKFNTFCLYSFISAYIAYESNEMLG